MMSENSMRFSRTIARSITDACVERALMYSTLKESIPEPMRVRRSNGGERQLKPKGGLACIGFILSVFGADGIVSAAEKPRL